MSTETSGTRGSVVRAPVMRSTMTSACSWSKRAPVVGLGPFGGDGSVEHRGDLGVGFRIELEVGVAHAGDLVDPPLHVPLLTLVLQPVGARRAGEDPFEVAHLPFEHLDHGPLARSGRSPPPARAARPGRRRRACRPAGRSHRHDPTTPHPTPGRRTRPASRHTHRPGRRRHGPPDRNAGHHQPTSPPPDHRHRQRPDRQPAWRSGRHSCPAIHGPAAPSRPARPVLPDRTPPGRHRSTR